MDDTTTTLAPAPRGRAGTDEPAIHVSGLRKHYGEVRAVDGLDLTIGRGPVVALLGPNGAGKSTAVDMILGLTRPDAGSVSVFGLSPVDAVRSSRICAMLQEGSLLDDVTVHDIVALVASLHAKPMPVEEALRRAGVEDLADRRSTKLSGGQKQRVRFAVALVGDPDLLVLDEPTAAMDVGGRREFWTSMRRFTDEGGTVVFATHYLDEAEEFADRVVLMQKGRVIADGTVAEVRSVATGRMLRARIPGAAVPELLTLPGVATATSRGDTVEIKSSDSDATMRALLTLHPDLRDLEITAMGLEEAFLMLTGELIDDPNGETR